MNLKHIALLILAVAITAAGATLISAFSTPPASPISTQSNPSPPTPASTPPITYAFLPYWNVSATTPADLSQITHLAYFGIEPNEDGSIKKRTTPTQTEPGWLTLNKPETQQLLTSAQNQNIHTHLVIKMLKKDAIVVLLSSPQATQNLISTSLDLMQEYNFDGINIDFEPESAVDQTTAQNFTQFMSQLNTQLKAVNPDYQLSVDVYPSAATSNQIWQINELSQHVDYIIVMAYDYYRPSSTHSGPIAPLYHPQSSKNIMNHLRDFTNIIPAEQIVLGIPIYGYQWQTTDQNPQSPTFPGSSSTLSLKTILNNLASDQYTKNWNQDTLSHWLSFSNQGKQYQVHYDSPETIQLKLDLVEEAGLRGVALWALGYQPPGFTIDF